MKLNLLGLKNYHPNLSFQGGLPKMATIKIGVVPIYMFSLYLYQINLFNAILVVYKFVQIRIKKDSHMIQSDKDSQWFWW